MYRRLGETQVPLLRPGIWEPAFLGGKPILLNWGHQVVTGDSETHESPWQEALLWFQKYMWYFHNQMTSYQRGPVQSL